MYGDSTDDTQHWWDMLVIFSPIWLLLLAAMAIEVVK